MIVGAGHLGDFAAGATIGFKFNTVTNAALALSTLASGALSVYKDTDTTESTAGITLTLDFDSRTGMHDVVIVTSDGFYVAGSNYQVVITTGTVAGVSHVGYVVASFSIAHRPVQSVAAGAIGLLGIAVAEANRLADIIRRRTQANVEASSYGDALSNASSLYGAVQQLQEADTTTHAGKLTVFKTDGTTELAQLTLSTDSAGVPVTGIH